MNNKPTFFHIEQIFMILAGIRNYTERILAASDVQNLIGCLKLDNDYTEFFDRKDNDNSVSDVVVNIECVKELINIYIETYISLMRLYVGNNGNVIENSHISIDVKFRILIDILTFSCSKFNLNCYHYFTLMNYYYYF
jgi:hypothetical protein